MCREDLEQEYREMASLIPTRQPQSTCLNGEGTRL